MMMISYTSKIFIMTRYEY